MKNKYYNFELLQAAKGTPGNLNIGIRTVADDTGVSLATVQKILNGKCGSLDKILPVAKYLGVAWHELFDCNPYDIASPDPSRLERACPGCGASRGEDCRFGCKTAELAAVTAESNRRAGIEPHTEPPARSRK